MKKPKHMTQEEWTQEKKRIAAVKKKYQKMMKLREGQK